MRANVTDVQRILPTSTTLTNDQIGASLSAADVLVGSLSSGFSAERLKQIEIYLAAHYSAVSENDSCKDGNSIYGFKFGPGIGGTPFGQRANTLSGGYLREYDKQPVGMFSIGDAGSNRSDSSLGFGSVGTSSPSIPDNSFIPSIRSMVEIAAPVNEPVSLDEVKVHLRGLMGTSENSLLRSLITSTRLRVEQYINRALITQTWSAIYDQVPTAFKIEIPKPKLLTVDSITTYSTANAPTVYAPSNYFVDTFSEPGRIVLNDGQLWPTGPFRSVNAFIVQFTCGYGANTDVPEAIKQAIMQTIGFLYKNRDGMQDGEEIKELPEIAKGLLFDYIVRSV